MREWSLDVAMVGEELDRPGADIAFTLKFPKARRRTPDNRADFEEVEIELRDGRWLSSAPATADQGRKGRSKRAQICLDALQKALAEFGKAPPASSSTVGVHQAITLEQWRSIFNRMAPYGDDQADARRKAWQVGLEELTASRTVVKWGDWIWLP
jgi:hypothetical protein